MKVRILESGVVFVDETPIDLQVRGKSRMQQAYMWIYAGGGGGDPPYRFFEFSLTPSSRGKASDFLAIRI